ncbi:MAG: alpha-hydroxy-acid oxidizing protein [Xanthobacteraceae bacterium]|nr:alpha-hydroxy-acid oxidizing protein [Xanthobacteraceae bacterium]
MTEPQNAAAQPVPGIGVRRRDKSTDAGDRFLSLEDFEAVARRRLPSMLYGFIAGGAETNASIRANARSFQDYAFIPRVLADVSARSHRTTLFGRSYAAPFGIAPTGSASICAYRGDIALARVASESDIPMIVSAASLIRLEEIRQAGATTWYQAYLPGDPARIEPLVARVAASGYDTFVLTADVPVAANRENNIRNGFTVPIRPSVRLVWEGLTHPQWLLSTFARTLALHGVPHFENMDATRGPPVISRRLERALGNRDQLSWDHVKIIRRLWQGPFVVKGILSPADARTARNCGVDGIIVSNHGGRQLDGAIAPLAVLPRIVEAAEGMTVMLDGGIRRGSDVLKALALGADFVFAGRPFLFAAVADGERGVRRAIDILCSEISRNMALLGIREVAEIGAELIARSE